MEIIKPAWHWRYPPETDPLYIPNVDGIALHHMASATSTIWDVEKWHLDRSDNWKGFGYNWWVGFDGQVYEGRGFNSGAGVSNQNGHIISIGFQGNYHPSDKVEVNTVMPEAQFKAGVELINWIKSILPRKDITVDGHKRWEPTGCPGDFFPLKEMVGGIEMLKIGSFGEEVKKLQEKLNKLGHGLIVDGDFGPATNKAVISFQTSNELDPDGIVGSATMGKLDQIIVKLSNPFDVDWKTETENWKQKYYDLLGGVKALAERG